MKVVENLETEVKNNYGAVLYILNVTSRIKDYAFQINRLLQTEVKRSQEAEECKIYGFTAPNGVISHKDKRDSAHQAICSQLETLEKRAIIYNFAL